MTATQAVLFDDLPGRKPRESGEPRGFAARPGSGPVGETCGSCAHCARIGYHRRRYLKCRVIRHRWTHGPGTDIRAKAPACSFWQATTAEASPSC